MSPRMYSYDPISEPLLCVDGLSGHFIADASDSSLSGLHIQLAFSFVFHFFFFTFEWTEAIPSLMPLIVLSSSLLSAYMTLTYCTVTDAITQSLDSLL